MTLEEAEKRIAELRAGVARHDEFYFRRAAPEVRDHDYDRLKRELNELGAEFPEFAAASTHTVQVGSDRTEGFQTYRHRERMMSLDNTDTVGELWQFYGRLARLLDRSELSFVIEPKL